MGEPLRVSGRPSEDDPVTEPTDLSVVRGKREAEAICIYCGGKPHKTQLACPRIAHISVNEEGYCDGITFRDDFFDDDPPEAA